MCDSLLASRGAFVKLYVAKVGFTALPWVGDFMGEWVRVGCSA